MYPYDQMKKVSVVIPCYNIDSYLDRCWKSLTSQTIGLENIECIFVDDCSTDNGNTLSKLKDIESRAPESVFIISLDENSGPGGARNVGLQYANGKYIQFFDADDELDVNALNILFETAEQCDADIIQYNHLYIAGNQRKSSQNSPENKLYTISSKEDRIPFLNSSIVTYGCTNKFIKRELIEKAGCSFPSRSKYEEPLFIYPLFLYANKVYKLNADLYHYYFREGSMITSELGKKLLDHPKVQLMLLEYCMNCGQIYEEFRDVIEMYFFWSFYLETISYAGTYNDAFIPLEYFKFMQKACKELCKDWRSNPFIKMIPETGLKALESIDRSFNDQAEFDRFLYEERNCI